MADISKMVLPGSSTQHTIVAGKLLNLSNSFTQVESTTAELSHPVGSYLMLDNRLCRVISPIARGDTIEPRYSMPTPRNVELVHFYDDVMPKLVEVTQAQYDALSSSEKARSDVAYMITDSDEDEEETIPPALIKAVRMTFNDIRIGTKSAAGSYYCSGATASPNNLWIEGYYPISCNIIDWGGCQYSVIPYFDINATDKDFRIGFWADGGMTANQIILEIIYVSETLVAVLTA